MSVPKRRPPRPHSCSTSRSPRCQWAAAKPSQVMNPNRAKKTMRATQLMSCMSAPARLAFGNQVDDRRDGGADQHQRELEPVEERQPDPGWLEGVVQRHPQCRYEFREQQEVPPVPAVMWLRPRHHIISLVVFIDLPIILSPAR